MNKKWIYAFLLALILGLLFFGITYKDKVGLVGKYQYGVSADHPEAVHIGMEVLQNGGNAIDAAIAVSYALGVTEPFGSGIGGGGLMVVHPNQKNQDPVVFDYKETFPVKGKNSKKDIGVPGFVRGMELIHKKYGTVSLEELIEPSVKLCEEGFEVSELLTRRLTDASYRLQTSQIPHFFPGGGAIKPGQVLKQEELALTLKKIQKEGSNAFYKGKTARDISEASKGIYISDLESYQPFQTIPVKAKIGNFELVTVPPPAGGPVLIQFLKMAESLGLKDLSSSDSIQKMGAIQGSLDDIRRKYIGDPKFVDVPVKTIISKEFLHPYIEKIRNKSFDVQGEDNENEAEGNTTHFVIVDKNGMMVSCTNTLSNFFGSGVYVDGFFLNNKLKAFSSISNSPNASGPGKRSFTFTAPSIFTENNQPVLGIGASGGPRITFMLAEVILRHLFHNEGLQQAISHSRFYVKRNVVYVEKELSLSVKKELQRKGYYIEVKPPGVFYGGVQGIRVNQKTKSIDGGYDFRRDGAFQEID